MFSPPIRPIQSSEIRRVDEVTTRKVVERVPSSLARTTDDVRITIGANARRLAQDAELPERTSDAPDWQFDEPAEPDTIPTFERPDVPLSGDPSEANAGLRASAQETPGSNTFANRALRALSTIEAAASGSLLTGTDDAEGVWDIEASSRVPFEVLQRAVTQATAGAEEGSEQAGYSPSEPVFLPPENGGKPFGRAVPFEFTPEAEERQEESRELTDTEVDEMISELAWELPVKEPSDRPLPVSV